MVASIDKNGEAFRDYLKINETDHDKQTVFHKAAQNEDHLLLKALFRYAKYLRESENLTGDLTGFSDALCKTDQYGQSVLHIACQQGKRKVLKMLLKFARMENCLETLFGLKNCGKSAFWKAFESGDCIKLKIMLDEAQTGNCLKQLVSCKNQQDQTLFHLAFQSQSSNEQCLEMIINAAKGVTLDHLVNQKDINGKYHLHFITTARDDILKLAARADTGGEAFTKYINEMQDDEQIKTADNKMFKWDKQTVFHNL